MLFIDFYIELFFLCVNSNIYKVEKRVECNNVSGSKSVGEILFIILVYNLLFF